MKYLQMYVLYYSPLDYRDKWVLRRWTIGAKGPVPDDPPMAVENTREKAVKPIEYLELHRMVRNPKDEDQIKEVWL